MIESREDRPGKVLKAGMVAALTADEREAWKQFVIGETECGKTFKEIAEAMELPLRKLMLFIKDDAGLEKELLAIREADDEDLISLGRQRLRKWLSEGSERTQTTLLQFILKTRGGFADQRKIEVDIPNLDPEDLASYATPLVQQYRTAKSATADNLDPGFGQGVTPVNVDAFDIIQGGGK